MSFAGPYRIIQVHPTRRCNLRCLHCYSDSGPARGETLDPAILESLIADAAVEGYGILSVSGGEPLLYDGLVGLLDHARERGLLATVTTNGILLDERWLELLAPRVSLLAISLDGRPESHDRLRGPRSFSLMQRRLEGLRRSGLRFGFIFTLTNENVHELDWVARFALEQGAALLQIHPLEEVGRARSEMPGQRPDPVEAGVAYLEFVRLRHAVGNRMAIRLDLAHRELLEAGRGIPPRSVETARLADLVNPLVVETDGTVVPLQHGLPRRYALGNIREQPLAALARRWATEGFAEFRARCEQTHAELAQADGIPVFNWYERVAADAGSSSQGGVRRSTARTTEGDRGAR